MVFDFSTTTGTIYIDGESDKYPYFRLRLVSMYNNKGLENNELATIALTIRPSTTRYTKFDYDFTGGPLEDIIDQDINGYYMAYFEGSADRVNWTQIAKYPSKVKTQFTENYPQQYQSDNEDNEQYVYYRS